MMRKALPTAAALVLALAGTVPATELAPPPDGSADQVMTMQNGKTVESKVYFSGKRIRLETMGAVVVMDPSAKKQFLILPAPMGCLDQPFKEDPKSIWTTSGGQTKIESVGKETVDGHPAEKFRVSGTVNDKPFEQFLWRATDLKGFPIKQAAGDGTYESNFKNIKLGKQEPKLFEKPADCKASPDFGAMMKSMQQQGHGHEHTPAAEGSGDHP